jgi:hypothetical protein
MQQRVQARGEGRRLAEAIRVGHGYRRPQGSVPVCKRTHEVTPAGEFVTVPAQRGAMQCR